MFFSQVDLKIVGKIYPIFFITFQKLRLRLKTKIGKIQLFLIQTFLSCARTIDHIEYALITYSADKKNITLYSCENPKMHWSHKDMNTKRGKVFWKGKMFAGFGIIFTEHVVIHPLVIQLACWRRIRSVLCYTATLSLNMIRAYPGGNVSLP